MVGGAERKGAASSRYLFDERPQGMPFPIRLVRDEIYPDEL